MCRKENQIMKKAFLLCLLSLLLAFPFAAACAEGEQPETAVLCGKAYDVHSTELNIARTKIEDIDKFSEELAQFTDLTYIDMCDCWLSNEKMEILCERFPDVKIVWKLYLGPERKWSLRTDAVAFSVLIARSDYTKLKNEDLEIFKYCTDLVALDLGHQAITDITNLCEYLPNLRLLILADNRLTDISPLANLEHLHYLELFVNRITDITPLAECRELVDVNVSYNDIKDFSPLYDMPMLERLWLEKTKIPYSDLEGLVAMYPEAKVVFYGEGSVDQGWRVHERYTDYKDMFVNHTDGPLPESIAKFG